MTVTSLGSLENRYAVDGNWDIGIGLWLEASTGNIQINDNQSLWQDFSTIGADYTFKICPGLHILYEHFIETSGAKINEIDASPKTTASCRLILSSCASICLLSSFRLVRHRIRRD